MKKKQLFRNSLLSGLLLSALMITSCSDDDNNVVEPEPEPVPISVVLNEVQYQTNDFVEILNTGSNSADLSDYWLCLGPGTYQRIGDITAQSGSITNLQPGEYLVLPYNMPDDNAGLGLYSTNTFASADAIVDFVQYGTAGAARESVAVEAGIWTLGEFVPTVLGENNSIIFDGSGNGAANWAETTLPTFGQPNQLMMPVRSIVINEVQYGNQDVVELFNNGDVTIDLETYWLCLGPGTYQQIGNLTPQSGNIQLAPGEFVALPYSMPDDQGGLGLYSVDQFANPDAIVDFVQYGAAGAAREDVAAQAGIWTAGDFVPTVRLESYSIEFDGEGDASTDWAEEINPSLGVANDTQNPTTTFDITISNVIDYLNVHTFTDRIRSGEATTRGPLNMDGDQYQITFPAVRGTRFTPVTMMGNSNDWFLAPEDLAGIDLFPNGGPALDGVDIADQLVLYDLGTEADNMPANFPPAGANVGPDDANPLVRLVDRGGRRGDFYMTAILDYAVGDGSSAGTFTLTITAIRTPDAAQPASSQNGFVVTPGIVVLHTQPEPLFTLGEEDRGVGLEAIAEDGNPDALDAWFNEVGTNGAPLRLASTLTVFSPGLVYAFNTDADPFFVQGGTVNPESGLEQLAEDGNNLPAVAYFESLGLPVSASTETTNVGPGEDLTFTIEVPQDQNYKLGFGTMFVDSNDWFISHNNDGVAFFDENGTPVSGSDNSIQSYLFDLGTEEEEPVGFGANQAPRQAGPNQGPADDNTTIRRQATIEDVQFGKGLINNGPGVVFLEDPRGGYNVIRITIQPR